MQAEKFVFGILSEKLQLGNGSGNPVDPSDTGPQEPELLFCDPDEEIFPEDADPEPPEPFPDEDEALEPPLAELEELERESVR